jgi:ribosomal protein S18 acetylase RimI-like enzyme
MALFLKEKLKKQGAMEIKTFTVADLGLALLSEDFWLTKTLPITKQRALSICHNPRAEKDDPALLVAYQDNQVVGYLGILPDKVFFNNADHKLGWLTGWWVDPCLATKGVGAILLYKALNAYRDRVGVSGGSKEARKVLHASQKFVTLEPLKGLDIRFRFNATRAILRKFPWMKIFRIGFKIADVMLDEIVNLRRLFWERRTHIRQRLTFEYVSSIDAETGRFIERHYQHDLTRKGKADLDWIMTYPWIVSAPQKDSASRRYYFSSISARFFYLGVKVFEQNNGMVGFLMLSVRNDRMRVVYSHFENRHAPSIAAAAVYQALAMDVSTLSLYDERLVKSVAGLRCPFWSTQSVSRGFFLSKAFADSPVADCRLHGGDGDFAFY